MRKCFLSALMISLLLLTGCGSAQEESKIEEFRAAISESERVSFIAEMHTDDGEIVADYVLRCTRSGEETVMELLSPELIAGVTARISGKQATLDFDGLSFAAGSIGGKISPMEVPDVLLDGMEKGSAVQFCRETWEEQDTLTFSVDMGESTALRIHLDATSLCPLYGEISVDGNRIADCRIRDWQME